MRAPAVTLSHVVSGSLRCPKSRYTRSPPRFVSPTNRLFVRPYRLAHQSSWNRREDTAPLPDTIYALSTASGRAAIAVIRVSGPACLDIYGRICPGTPFPNARVATLRKLYDPCPSSPGNPAVLDSSALVLYFPSPNTVTGEDVLEFQVHGGPAIVRSILEAIPKCVAPTQRKRTAEYSFIRPAEAGEFTKRGFYNGRADLTQAEALGDVLAAETEQQRRLAVSGSENTLAKRYEEWRRMLLYARGEMEALIDFSEDQHFDESPAELVSNIRAQVVALQHQIDIHLQNASKGELLRNGISIALLGAPNAGKSSLLNRIVGREAAIVSTEEGTTRDIVDVSVDIGGWLCRLGDMAGLREKAGGGSASETPIGLVETEGIRRARARALESDLVIVLLSVEIGPEGLKRLPINSQVLESVQECIESGKEVMVVINKLDLIPPDSPIEPLISQVKAVLPQIPNTRIFTISCKEASTPTSRSTDPGNMQTFLNGLTTVFHDMTTAETTPNAGPPSYWTASLSVSHRQGMYLRQCRDHLNVFLSASTTTPTPTAEEDVDIVALAEDLRFAAACLGKITGREGGDVEDVLGVVFEK